MSEVQSLSDSPGSASSQLGLGNSLMWEKVALSPLELLSVQLESELQHAQELAKAVVKQNKNDVDLDTKTRKAAGRVTVEVLAAKDLALAQHALLAAGASASQQPALYVSTQVTPLSAFEKATKKHLRTAAVTATETKGAASVSWQETLVYEGAKSKKFGVKVSLNSSSEILADVVLGEVELRSNDFLDQQPHEKWYDLKTPASAVAAAEGSVGQLLLRVTFEHSARERYEQVVAALSRKKQENDADIERFKETSKLVNAPVRHPAAYGTDTARAELYIPGNKFHVDAHHPAAVSVAPLSDKSRVVTPYGRGVIVSYRPVSKMYVVQLDADTASKNQTLAYLRPEIVKEESDEPHFRMHAEVATPYGKGTLEEIRPRDDVFIVKTDYARLFMHRKDVKLPEKTVAEMTTKDLTTEATTLADQGNEHFRGGALNDAVYSYLRALGFLQRVDQETATHKEKATMIQTMIRCHLNIGACKLKLDAFQDAEVACTNALNILAVLADNKEGKVVMWMGRLGMSDQLMFEDWPSKARFRRAQACVKQEKYVAAKQDLLVAVKLNPKDKSCRMLLERVNKLVDKQKRDEKKAWGGIFDTIEGKPSASASTQKTTTKKTVATKTKSTGASTTSSSIFTRKTKRETQAAEPWYATTQALATVSLVTAGVAAVALLALKPKSA